MRSNRWCIVTNLLFLNIEKSHLRMNQGSKGQKGSKQVLLASSSCWSARRWHFKFAIILIGRSDYSLSPGCCWSAALADQQVSNLLVFIKLFVGHCWSAGFQAQNVKSCRPFTPVWLQDGKQRYGWQRGPGESPAISSFHGPPAKQWWGNNLIDFKLGLVGGKNWDEQVLNKLAYPKGGTNAITKPGTCMLQFHLRCSLMAEQKMRASWRYFEMSCCSARIWSTVDSLLTSNLNLTPMQW